MPNSNVSKSSGTKYLNKINEVMKVTTKYNIANKFEANIGLNLLKKNILINLLSGSTPQ
ncbi:MAG: hypothetical protein KC414_03270 [Romboutsia sp.]|nr:hypothetical protein [Romboutsia sp.]